MDEETQQKVWVLLWRWWSARIKVNAGEKMLSAQEIRSIVTFYVSEFEKLRKKEIKKGQKRVQKWEPPQSRFCKINIDAAFRAKTKTGGWGL